jgi:YHS domain-containing protein
MVEAIDVVCGMTVDTETAVSAEYEGQTYYFCCNGCKGAFEKAAAYYIEEYQKGNAQPGHHHG